MGDYWEFITSTVYGDLGLKGMVSSVDKEEKYFEVDNSEEYISITIPAPGITQEYIKAKVSGNLLEIQIKKSTFVAEKVLTFVTDFRIKEKHISIVVEQGLIKVLISKPREKEFEVEIN